MPMPPPQRWPPQDAGGVLPALQRLSYAGKHLDDAQRTLEQYGIAYWHAKFPHWPLRIRKRERGARGGGRARLSGGRVRAGYGRCACCCDLFSRLRLACILSSKAHRQLSGCNVWG
jgi:hypothetical protein